MKESRMERVNEAVKQELCLIFETLKDPRIDVCTNITRTETTNDLKYCKVYVSVLGDAEKKQGVKKALEGAKGYIRHELATRLNLRYTPEIQITMDDSLEYAQHMEELLASVRTEEPAQDAAEEEA